MGKDNKKKKRNKSDKKLHVSDVICELKSLKKRLKKIESNKKGKNNSKRPKLEKSKYPDLELLP